MAIKPILFNTEMVRASLDGRKTCTILSIKPQPDEKHTNALGFVTHSSAQKKVGCFGFGTNQHGGSIQYATPPYQPGDILYVRETFYRDENCILYKANNENLTGYRNMKGEDIAVKWSPSIHMPKEAARIWLKVMNVRVERLQEITDEQAKREGIQYDECQTGFTWKQETDMHNCYTTPIGAMQALWNSTIKKSDLDRYGWDASPWVWVIEFERCKKPKGV